MIPPSPAILALAPALGLLPALSQEAVPREAAVAPSNDEPRATLFLHSERVPLVAGGFASVERGILQVPLVRSDPASRTIGVEVYRFRAAEGADPDTPPIFQLKGGPGWPGLDLSEPGTYESEVLPWIERSDLVLVGQRGIGSSKPDTVCAPVPRPPKGSDPTEEELAAAVRQACRDCREYWESQGYDLSGFNVIEAAADVDDARRLLGYEKITISGGSFGSHWGMAVMRYHPEGVARAVLTGMEGPDHTYDMPSGVLAAFERMAGEAELSDGLIAHVPDEGLIGALETVIARLEEEPVEVEVRHPVGGQNVTVRIEADDVRDLAMGYTNRAGSRSGATTWPADVIALHRGEFEDAAIAKLQNESREDGGLPTASFFMLDCGSGISPAREEELVNDPAANIVGNLGRFYQTACPAWGADLGDDFRAGFVTDVPTVIVHGTWDISTPFDNALELLTTFDDGHFVVVEGGTHGALREALGYSDDFRAALMDFLATGDRSNLPDEIRMPPIAWAPPR